VLAATALSLTSHGQGTPIAVAGIPQCAACRVVLDSVAVVGTPTDSVLLNSGALARDGQERYFADDHGRTRVLMFDSLLRLRKSFGRGGEGPGEFPTPPGTIVPVRGDTLYVFALPRVVVFSPSQSVVRSVTVGMWGDANALPSGEIVVGGLGAEALGPRRERVTVLAPSGETRRTIAPVPRRDSVCTRCELSRIHSNAARDGIWIVHRDRYELEEWRLDGTWLRTLSVQNSPWYRSATASRGRGSMATPLYGALESSDGYLWVIGQIPPESRNVQSQAQWARESSTMVEVIDLRTNLLVASREFKGVWLNLVRGAPLIYAARFDENDVVSMVVYSPTLVTANRR
jgi:hypothetical protein